MAETVHPWTAAFNAWMAEVERPQSWVAYKLGVSAVALHNWKHGAIPRTSERLAKIERLSGGRVKASLVQKAA